MKRKTCFKLIQSTYLLLLCFACLAPFIWMVMVSFRNRVDIINPVHIFVKPVL